jgi:hypothetical protein|nr:MAG TPA: hypothetical protein [Caudoviricetes sp.]
MNNKQKILIKMFKRDDFEFLEEEGIRYYEDLYDLLVDKADDLYDLFELGQRNPDFDDNNGLFYCFTENKILPVESFELLDFNIEKFLKYYKKEYGEDELYKKYLTA